jgi:hypothetical protein
VRRLANLIIIMMLFFLPSVYGYESLQDVYDLAGPQGEYDKFIELDPNIEYLGDLWIGQGVSVRIIGNGALIHGRPYFYSIGINFSRLDISGCVIIGGGYGISFTTDSYGDIFNNTVISCSGYGIGVVNPSNEQTTRVWDNIITDCDYGFYCSEDNPPDYLGYNTIWNCVTYRYAQLCPD